MSADSELAQQILSDDGALELGEIITFPEYLQRFKLGLKVKGLEDWDAVCEDYIIEFKQDVKEESLSEVIHKLSEAYLIDPRKTHLRKYLQKRLTNDLNL